MVDLAAHREALARTLASEPDVRWAYLFGSAARGGAFRDLDVAVMLSPQARGLLPLGAVVAALEECARDIHVDVVELGGAPPELAGVIAREGQVLLDRDPAARMDWELEATRRALDIAPWLRRYDELREAAARARGR